MKFLNIVAYVKFHDVLRLLCYYRDYESTQELVFNINRKTTNVGL